MDLDTQTKQNKQQANVRKNEEDFFFTDAYNRFSELRNKCARVCTFNTNTSLSIDAAQKTERQEMQLMTGAMKNNNIAERRTREREKK